MHTIGTPWCFDTTAEACEAVASFDSGMTNEARAELTSRGWNGKGLEYQIDLAHMHNPAAGRHVRVLNNEGLHLGFLRVAS